MAAAHSPPRELINRYRDLLVATPSDVALRSAVGLVQDIAEVRFGIAAIDDDLKRLDEEEDLEARAKHHLSEEILEFMRGPNEAKARRRQAHRIALQRRRLLIDAAHTLGLPAFIETRGIPIPVDRGGLFLDATLVVFHQLYFGPWLTVRDREPELATFFASQSIAFAERLPPADRARVRALVLEASGQSDMADMFRDEALRLTEPESHEFMTVLQTAWAALVERKLSAPAMLLLLREAPRVPREHLAEFNELVLETAHSTRAA